MIAPFLAVLAVLSTVAFPAMAQTFGQSPPAAAPIGQPPPAQTQPQPRPSNDRKDQGVMGGTTVGNGFSTRMGDSPGTRMSDSPGTRMKPQPNERPGREGQQTGERPDRPEKRYNENKTFYQGQPMYNDGNTYIVTPGLAVTPNIEEIRANCDQRWDELGRANKTWNMNRQSFIDECVAGRQ
jgi:hypothetical protein